MIELKRIADMKIASPKVREKQKKNIVLNAIRLTVENGRV